MSYLSYLHLPVVHVVPFPEHLHELIPANEVWRLPNRLVMTKHTNFPQVPCHYIWVSVQRRPFLDQSAHNTDGSYYRL
jgi:hypothetical protein